jgi:hypothetical protein
MRRAPRSDGESQNSPSERPHAMCRLISPPRFHAPKDAQQLLRRYRRNRTAPQVREQVTPHPALKNRNRLVGYPNSQSGMYPSRVPLRMLSRQRLGSFRLTRTTVKYDPGSGSTAATDVDPRYPRETGKAPGRVEIRVRPIDGQSRWLSRATLRAHCQQMLRGWLSLPQLPA